MYIIIVSSSSSKLLCASVNLCRGMTSKVPKPTQPSGATADLKYDSNGVNNLSLSLFE